MKMVAITGASGHIGNVLCRELLAKGISVRAMVHRHSESLKDTDAIPISCRLEEVESLDKLVNGVDTVFHLAAKISLHKRDEQDVFRVNLNGTDNLIKACVRNGVNTLVHFSSIHVLDPHPIHEILNEDRPYNTRSNLAYERSKLESERLVLEASDIRSIILIPSAVIGPFDFGPSLFGQGLIKMAKGKLPMTLPYGFNWVDVRDIVNAAIQAAELSNHGSRYILSGDWKTLPEIATIANRFVGRNSSPIICPPFLAHQMVPALDWILQKFGKKSLYNKASIEILRDSPRLISNHKAMIDLNFKPRPIEISIMDSLKWFKQHNKI